MEKHLTPKDLITIGLFTAIYFVLFFVTGMTGYVPIMMVALPFLCPLVTGIPFVLFLTRVKKFGMVTIMGILIGLLMMLFGHPWPCMIGAVVAPLAADLIMCAGGYQKWGFLRAGYVVFSEWILGPMLPFFIMRGTYFQSIRDGYGSTYADTLSAIMQPWVLGLMVVLVIVGALCGAMLGKKLLKKHFKRAGIA